MSPARGACKLVFRRDHHPISSHLKSYADKDKDLLDLVWANHGATHSISLCIANRFTVTGPGSGHSGLTLLVVRTGISQARACALWVLRSCSAAESSKFKELFTL